MPTATKFTALGVGNGFPFCLSKFNVNDPYDDGKPFTNYVALTLAGAMQLYRNVYSVSGSAYFQDLSVDDTVKLSNEPKVRACKHSETDRKEDIDQYGAFEARIWIRYSSAIYRLYDGDTSDEGNFLGYGVSSAAGAFTGDFYNGAEEYYASFYKDEDPPFNEWETRTDEVISFGSVDLLKIRGTSGEGIGTEYDATLNDDLDFYTY